MHRENHHDSDDLDLRDIFFDPRRKQLAEMKNCYRTTKEYCMDIRHNLMCEYYEFFHKKPEGSVMLYLSRYGSGRQHSKWKFHSCASIHEDEVLALQSSLLSVKDVRFFVNNAIKTAAGELVLMLQPLSTVKEGVEAMLQGSGAKNPVLFHVIGYMGTFISEMNALHSLMGRRQSQQDNVLQMVVNPSSSSPGEWAPVSNFRNDGEIQMNDSQRKAVVGLQKAVEMIQGPPGTGKSTTIVHVVTTRVPANKLVIVTCTRNVAVDAIVSKVAGAVGGEVVAFGRRLGPMAQDFTLDARCEKAFLRIWHSAICEWREELLHVREMAKYKEPAATWRWERLFRFAIAERELQDVMFNVNTGWTVMRNQLHKRMLLRARVLVATVHSLHNVLSTWENVMQGVDGMSLQPPVHTVIVDECGCTPESSTALLVNLRPKNLLLIGDHKQLPPFTAIPPQDLVGKNYPRSLLERCVVGSGGKVRMLTMQYRMHPDIASFVSNQFYCARLVTAGLVTAAAAQEQSVRRDALRWVECAGKEVRQDGKSSPRNEKEADVVVAEVVKLNKSLKKNESIAVLTFYRGQLLLLTEMLGVMIDTGVVQVLTVDACQGSEFDHVILSPVRSNARRDIGFLSDAQRMNVACSRARKTLTVVGCKKTLAQGAKMWKNLRVACESE